MMTEISKNHVENLSCIWNVPTYWLVNLLSSIIEYHMTDSMIAHIANETIDAHRTTLVHQPKTQRLSFIHNTNDNGAYRSFVSNDYIRVDTGRIKWYHCDNSDMLFSFIPRCIHRVQLEDNQGWIVCVDALYDDRIHDELLYVYHAAGISGYVPWSKHIEWVQHDLRNRRSIQDIIDELKCRTLCDNVCEEDWIHVKEFQSHL